MGLMRDGETMHHDDRLPNAPAGGQGERHLEARYDPASEAVDLVLRRGKCVYRIAVDIRHDLEDRDLTPERFLEIVLLAGEILAMPLGATDLDRRTGEDISFSFIFASVLSLDLVAEALGLSPEQVTLLTRRAGESCRPARGETFPCGFTDLEPLTGETACGLPLGEILIRLGGDALAIAWALREKVYGDDRLIGEILVSGGRVGAEIRDEALRLQQGPPAPMAQPSKANPKRAVARRASETRV